MQRLISSFLKGSVFRDGVTRKVTSLVKSVVRQAWASNIDLRDPRFLAFAVAQNQFLQLDYEEYSIENSGAFTYFLDASLARTPDPNDYKGFGNVARVICFLPPSNYTSSASWLSSSLLCDGSLSVHYAMPKEEAGLRDNIDLYSSKIWCSI